MSATNNFSNVTLEAITDNELFLIDGGSVIGTVVVGAISVVGVALVIAAGPVAFGGAALYYGAIAGATVCGIGGTASAYYW